MQRNYDFESMYLVGKCLILCLMLTYCDVQGQQEKHDYLLHQLDTYSTSELPCMPDLLTMGATSYDAAHFEIESHWTKVVGVSPSELTKKQKDQQEAIWELLHTEVQYIRKLQVVIDVSTA